MTLTAQTAHPITAEFLRARRKVYILGPQDADGLPLPPSLQPGCAHARAGLVFGWQSGRSQGFRMFLQHAYRFWASTRPAHRIPGGDPCVRLNEWLKAAAAAWAAAPLHAGTESRYDLCCAAFKRLWNSAAAHALRLDCGCERAAEEAYRAGLKLACPTTPAGHAELKTTRTRVL